MVDPALRQVFATCRAFRITDADRLEWASIVLNCNVESFNQLGPIEVARLRDAANGAAYMARICIERVNGERI